MSQPGHYFPPKLDLIFIVEIFYAIVCEDCIETARTWTAGPSERIAMNHWRRSHPGVEVVTHEITAGNRRKKVIVIPIGPRRMARTGKHPNIAV